MEERGRAQRNQRQARLSDQAEIGGGGHGWRASFSLPGDDDKAYAKDVADEQKLLAAMAGGGSMVVKATSAKGTATIDQYSLEGLAAALLKAQQACP